MSILNEPEKRETPSMYDEPMPDSPTTEAFLKAQQLKQLGEPIGVNGLNYQGNFVYEEFLPQLRWPRAGKIYQEMSDNDATIAAVLYMIEQLTLRAGWSVKAAGDLPVDQEKADFLQQCMNDMEESWDDLLLEILSELIYGFSFHEIVYKYRRGKVANMKISSKFTDNRIGWRKMPIRSQQSLYGWHFDDEGDVTHFIQELPNTGQHFEIPIARGILFRTKHARNNPEGRSLLRGAYRSWYFKKKMEEIEGIGIERDLAGLPVLTPAEGVDVWGESPEAKQKLARATHIVQNIKRDKSEGVVLPFGWDLSLLSTGGQRQFDTNEIINRWDQRIAITMLSDIVMLGADKVGSFALADAKKSLLSASLEAQLHRIADNLNSIAVTQLFALNTFDEGSGLPELIPGEVEMPDIAEVASILGALGLDAQSSKTITNAILAMASLPSLTEAEFAELSKREEVKSNGNGSNMPTKDPANNGANAGNPPKPKKDGGKSPDSKNAGK